MTPVWIFLVIVAGSILFGWGYRGRAQEIEATKAAAPVGVTARDTAYVVALHQRFGTRTFRLASISGKHLPANVSKRFEVRSTRFDDAAVIGRRLPDNGLIETLGTGKYRLTDLGVRLAKENAV